MNKMKRIAVALLAGVLGFLWLATIITLFSVIGCSEKEEVATPTEPQLDGRAAEIYEILLTVGGEAKEARFSYASACAPDREFVPFSVVHLSEMAIEAASLEAEGYEMKCISFADGGDGYGAVHPEHGVLFECSLESGLFITMLRGSLEDQTAECAVVQ